MAAAFTTDDIRPGDRIETEVEYLGAGEFRRVEIKLVRNGEIIATDRIPGPRFDVTTIGSAL